MAGQWVGHAARTGRRASVGCCSRCEGSLLRCLARHAHPCPCRLTVRLLAAPVPQGCVIEDSLLMGADYYEQYEECEAFTVRSAPAAS